MATATRSRLQQTWQEGTGLLGWLSTVDNSRIATLYIITTFAFFLLAGVQALLIRLQLARPENTFLDPQTYNQFFTMHGSTMMFLFAVPILEGFANFLLPQMLGARELPFPRMTAFGYWAFLSGSLLFYSSFLFGAVPDGGWFAYVPLTGPEYSPGLKIDFWLLGLSVAEIAAIGASIELIVAVLKMRAPGMSLNRMPIFGWAILVMGFSMLFGFTPLLVASTFLELDRLIGTAFYDPERGGQPVLWQHLFWIFGHPEVYIQFIPAAGIISMVIPVFARRAIPTFTLVILSLVATGILSFGLWAHHMFTVGIPLLGLAFFGAASMSIAIPSGIQVFSWIATIWGGRPVFRTPMLFALGFIVIFVLGGMTGVMVAVMPFDWQVHDSFFVVAHFHYVLIGGVVFPVFAALYYWLPKLWGFMLDERLGRWNFWLMFIGFNVAFFPQHISGLLGMPRRVYTYQAGIGWELPNLISTIGAFILASGILIFVANVVYSFRRGVKPGDDPWGGDTLEWSTSSPPPNENFRVLPIVRSRHPLWEQDSLEEGDPDTRAIVRGLADYPDTWRATLLTSVMDARPHAITWLPGPTVWPIVLAATLTVLTIGTMFKLGVIATIAAITSLIAVIGWLWPSRAELASVREPGNDRLNGLTVHASGPGAHGWWAVVLMEAVLATALASMVFSYYYILYRHAEWPPVGIAPPDLLLPGLATLGLFLIAAPMFITERALRGGDAVPLQVGPLLAAGLGAVVLVLQLLSLGGMGFGPGFNAYSSLVFVIVGFHAILVAVGIIWSLVIQVQAWLGYFSQTRFLGVQTTALYWYFVIASWLVVAAVVYLSPYVW